MQVLAGAGSFTPWATMGDQVAFNQILGSDRFKFKKVSFETDWNDSTAPSSEGIGSQSSGLADLDRALLAPCCPENAGFTSPSVVNPIPKTFEFFRTGQEDFDFDALKEIKDDTVSPSGENDGEIEGIFKIDFLILEMFAGALMVGID